MSKNYLKVFLVSAFAVSFLMFGAFHYASANFISDLFGGDNSAAVSGSSSSSPLRVYGLRVYKSGKGTVASDDGKINCGSKCSQSYSQGSTVTLTANPASGFTFVRWSTGWFDKSCPGTGSCSLTMNKSKYARAYFKNSRSASVTKTPQASRDGIQGGDNSSASAIAYEIAVKKSGIGSVKSVPEGINCVSGQNNRDKNVCEYAFPQGQVVVLYASPDAGSNYEFGVWGGDCRNTPKNSPCRLTADRNRQASVSFDLKTQEGKTSYKLSVVKLGNGDGKVESLNFGGNPNGMVSCGADCSENVQSNCELQSEGGRTCTNVTLKATPLNGSTFGWWGGCESRTNAKDECVVSMDRNREITAFFNGGNANQQGLNYKLTVQKPVGGTVVNRSGNGRIDCGTLTNTCSSNYSQNTTVNLEALPDSGYTFNYWTGCDNQSGTKCVVNMTRNKNVAAFFRRSVSGSSSSSSSFDFGSIYKPPFLNIINSTNSNIAGTISFKDKNGADKTCSLPNNKSTCFFDYTNFNIGQTVKLIAKAGSSIAGATFAGNSNCVLSKTYGDNDTCTLVMTDSPNGQKVTPRFFTLDLFGSSSSSSSVVSSGAIELKVREVLTGGRMGAYADEIALNNPNSEGTESVDLKWTVPSDASNCSLTYSFNAQPLQWGQLASSDIIAESGKTRETGNYSKHGTEDYVVNLQNKATATYALSCRSGGALVKDEVHVTF